MATKGWGPAATTTPQETHQVLRMDEVGPVDFPTMGDSAQVSWSNHRSVFLQSTAISAPLLIALSLASCKERRAFLHKSSTPLVIIGTVKARLDGALDHGEIAFGLCIEQFSTREFGSP